MKLIELVNYLLNPEKLKDLYAEHGVSEDAEALQIYLTEKLDLEAEIKIFEIEETGGYLAFEKDGVKYIELFTVDHAIDLIELDLDLKNKGYSDLQIAERLLDYRRRDA